jgi:hypothetical protein
MSEPWTETEKTRRIIAGAVVSLLTIALMGSIVLVISASLWSSTALAERDWVELTRDFLSVLLAPVIGLLSSILGFYHYHSGKRPKGQS